MHRITVRQLEAMIRLAEALAGLHLVDGVTPSMVREAFKLVQKSIVTVQYEGVDLAMTRTEQSWQQPGRQPSQWRCGGGGAQEGEQRASGAVAAMGAQAVTTMAAAAAAAKAVVAKEATPHCWRQHLTLLTVKSSLRPAAPAHLTPWQARVVWHRIPL